jgi:hypothetical protein
MSATTLFYYRKVMFETATLVIEIWNWRISFKNVTLLTSSNVAPGQILQSFPEPTHCLADKGLSLSVNVDSRRYEMPVSFTCGSAPYQTVNFEQACSDLPAIGIGNESKN